MFHDSGQTETCFVHDFQRYMTANFTDYLKSGLFEDQLAYI